MNSNQNKDNWVNKSLILLVCFLSFVLIFTGCNQVFADNPVVQHMQEGKDEFDFSLFSSGTLSPEQLEDVTGANEPGKNPSDDIPQDKKDIFNNFISKIQTSKNIQYTRILSYSEKPLIPNDEIETFLSIPLLRVIEEKDSFVIDSEEKPQRLLYSNGKSYLIDLTNKTNSNVEIGKKDKRHNLEFLANESRLELISVEMEEVGEIPYLVFNLTENSNISKWYFDKNGDLLLRMFLDKDNLYAIRYENLRFDEPFNEKLLTLDGVDTIISDYKTNSSEVVSEQPKTETTSENSTSSEPPKTTTPSSPENKSSTSSTIGLEKEEAKPSSDISRPSSQTAPDPSPSVGQASSPKIESKPTAPSIGTVVPGSSAESKSPEVSSRPEIKEYVPKVADPGEVKDYPHDVLPLLHSYKITSSEDDIKGERRKIYLTGNLEGSASNAASYYEDVLVGTVNYKTDEIYSEEEGMTIYVVSGRRKGWDITVEIREDHYSYKKIMNIVLDK